MHVTQDTGKNGRQWLGKSLVVDENPGLIWQPRQKAFMARLVDDEGRAFTVGISMKELRSMVGQIPAHATMEKFGPEEGGRLLKVVLDYLGKMAE